MRSDGSAAARWYALHSPVHPAPTIATSAARSPGSGGRLSGLPASLHQIVTPTHGCTGQDRVAQVAVPARTATETASRYFATQPAAAVPDSFT